MAADDAAVVVRLSANLKDYEAALKNAVRATERAAAASEKALSNIGKGGGASNVIQANFQKSASQIQNDARVLQYQLNDIFSGLASGQGMRAVQQQLGQIAQQLQGGSMIQGAKTLGAALMGMVNPIDLAIVAFGLATYAASKYFSESTDGSEESQKQMKAEAQELDEVISKWGDLLPALKAIHDQRQAIADQKTVQDVTGREIAKSYAEVKPAIEDAKIAIADLSMTLQNDAPDAVASMNDAFAELEKKIAAGTATSKDAQPVISQMTDLYNTFHTEGLKPVIDSLTKMAPLLDKNADANKTLAQQASAATQAAKDYAAFLKKISDLTQAHLTDVQKLNKEYQDYIATLGVLEDRQESILSKRATDAFMSGQVQLQAGSKAGDLIKREEGFRPGAYWDKNAFRVGYGSDTYVDSMGKVQKVTQDTVVTVEQATQDLGRRLGEFQATISRQIGPEFWKSLDEDQQAALTSIAYNYGSLPDSIVKAIQSGGGRDKVAQAIANLSANPDRRKREAELYGGSGFSLPKATTQLDDWNKKSADAIELAKQANEINADTTRSVNERSAAIEENKLYQEGLNAAVAQFGTVSDAQKAQIRATAHEMAQLGLAADNLKTSQEQATKASKQHEQAMAEFAQQVTQTAQTAIGGFVNDLRNGMSAGEAFSNMLDRIIDGLINMAIQAAFSKNALGGVIGNIFGVGSSAIAHGGGTVSALAAGKQHNVSPLAFAGAPRFAAGGVVGLAPGEVPIIAHRGEVIVPNARRLAGSGRQPTQSFSTSLGDINMDMKQTGLVAADNDSAKQFGINVQKIVQREMVRESRPGGLLRKVPNG